MVILGSQSVGTSNGPSFRIDVDVGKYSWASMLYALHLTRSKSAAYAVFALITPYQSSIFGFMI